MTLGLMRRFISRHYAVEHHVCHRPARYVIRETSPATWQQSIRSLADVRGVSELWFTNTHTLRIGDSDSPTSSPNKLPNDERKLKLGKTIGILHDQLPTLLASPLPQDILSPQITLHLFPSTHPHLPTVSGRIAYSAALWTAPVAWGRVPVVGNVRLSILSERMVKNGNGIVGSSTGSSVGHESLIVRWKTCGSAGEKDSAGLYGGTSGKGDPVDKITEILGGKDRQDREFLGLFIFEFDTEGRILNHTIEHAQQGGNWEKMTRVINVTDWLLGRARWRKSEEIPSLAMDVEHGEGRSCSGRLVED